MTKGSCFCGEVTYEYVKPMGLFQYCHCSRCRKVTGSAHAANLFVHPDDFQWLSGEANVGRYEPVDAKHFSTSFCKTCGSNLPWITQTGQVMVVPAGSLDEDPEVRPVQNIHYASKAEWFIPTSELPEFEGHPKK